MPIEFHCDHCGHKVRAADEHAGKRGKCPSCHQSVYIPTPSEQIEPLRLTPIDEERERQKRELLRETSNIVRRIREERGEVPEAPPKPEAPLPTSDARLPSDMETLVQEYILCMFEGNLTDAEELAAEIRRDLNRADEVIQHMMMDELPPTRIAHVPRPVIQGFMRQLREGA